MADCAVDEVGVQTIENPVAVLLVGDAQEPLASVKVAVSGKLVPVTVSVEATPTFIDAAVRLLKAGVTALLAPTMDSPPPQPAMTTVAPARASQRTNWGHGFGPYAAINFINIFLQSKWFGG